MNGKGGNRAIEMGGGTEARGEREKNGDGDRYRQKLAERGREKEREGEKEKRQGQVDKYMYKGQVVDLKRCRQTGRGGRGRGKLCR